MTKDLRSLDVERHLPAAILAQRMDRFRATLRSASIRVTPQRIEIFREVAGRLDHPDAEAVLRGVRARMPSVSLDTVYRTLTLFREVGLVAARRPRRDSVRFDGRLDSHHHYVCTRCGKTWDLDAGAVRVRHEPDACGALGTVDEARVEVRGVCRACSEGGAKKKRQRKRGGGA